MGDGNINFVYILEGPGGALCVKQGHPYVRIVKTWALTQVRTAADSSPDRCSLAACSVQPISPSAQFPPQSAVSALVQYLNLVWVHVCPMY